MTRSTRSTKIFKIQNRALLNFYRHEGHFVVKIYTSSISVPKYPVSCCGQFISGSGYAFVLESPCLFVLFSPSSPPLV